MSFISSNSLFLSLEQGQEEHPGFWKVLGSAEGPQQVDNKSAEVARRVQLIKYA